VVKKIEPEDVMASWSDFETIDGKSFATAIFNQQNPKAMFVIGQYTRRFMRAVSVGFIPHTLDFEDDDPVLKDNELLKISFAPIHANANAVALALKEGQMPRGDATWMAKSMRDAAEKLEEQLRNAPADGEEENVEELKTQFNSMTELMTSLGEQFTALSTSVESVTTEVAEIKSAVAELKLADTPANTDDKTTDPSTGDPTNDPDPAKGGDNEKPGAAADELDEDAELTPELQAQIDAGFEATDPADDTAQ
jgi:dsDNA-binding SOS-regulon protein